MKLNEILDNVTTLQSNYVKVEILDIKRKFKMNIIMELFANDYGLIHMNVIFAVIMLSIGLFVIAEVTTIQEPAFPIFLSIVLFVFSIILIAVSPKDIKNHGTDKQKAMLKQCQAESRSETNNYDNLSQLMIDCQKRHENAKLQKMKNK